jgi:protein transport protein SEC23
MADFEALKDQWSDVEDRDGIRLSWNTIPSSRMVRLANSVDITER